MTNAERLLTFIMLTEIIIITNFPILWFFAQIAIGKSMQAITIFHLKKFMMS